MNRVEDWPDEAEEQQLFAAIQAGGRRAWNDLAIRFLDPLRLWLARTVRGAAPEWCDTAAEDAIFDLLKRPELFAPTRLRVGAYLRMAARYDLFNLLAKERRAARAISLDSVAEPAGRGEDTRDGLTWDDPRLVAELTAFDATEVAAFELMLDGTRETAAFARRFGIEHLTANEQTTRVKRVKDRVKKRLSRALGGRQ